MELIFHEKQEGALCAQHCLNALLQGPYYTAVDLADLAAQLDEAERLQLTEGQNPGSPDYERALAQPSANMDDTGFFSVQVIAKAIAVWGLELVSFSSSDPVAFNARQNPIIQSAFICNYREHWLTIRRIGNQWFNLNSLLTGPELISDTYLSLFLAQLLQEGYTIYIVTGPLQDCPADSVLSLCPTTQAVRPRLINEDVAGARDPRRARGTDQPSGSAQVFSPTMSGLSEDEEFQQAMALSMGQYGSSGGRGGDDDLQLALQLSQSLMSPTQELSDPSSPMDFPTQETPMTDQSQVTSEEDDIQKAIQLSLIREASASGSGTSGAKPKAKADPPKTAVNPPTKEPCTSDQMYSSPLGSFARHGAQRKPPNAAAGEAPRMATLASLKQDESAPSPSRSSVPPPRERSRYSNPTADYTPPSRFGPSSASASSYSPPSRYPTSVLDDGGQRLGGVRPTGSISGASRGLRQSTPDKDEMRRRRLAFLDKMEREKKEQPGSSE